MGYLYVVLPAAFYLAFVLWPLLTTVRWSFFDYDGLNDATWVGLRNYADLLGDTTFRNSVLHAVVLQAFYAVAPIAIGLLLAAAITHRHVRGVNVFRSVLFLPQVVAPVVIAMIWRWVYEPNFGPLNTMLSALGLDSFRRPWLGDFDFALPSIGVIGTWTMFGLCMVLFVSGVQRIPTSLYEAVRLDGAGAFRAFVHVTLPGLRREITVAGSICMITGLRNFDLVYNLTRGGPGDETSVPVLLIYRKAFLTREVGSASAAAVLVVLVLVTASTVILRLREPGHDHR